MQIKWASLLALLWCLSGCGPKVAELNHDFVKSATAGKIDSVKALLDKGADINTQVEDGFSALMLAAGNGKTEMVKFLLEKGANPNLQGELKATALDLAAGNGHKEIVGLLIDHGADFRVSDTGLTPLMMAVAQEHSDVAELLISKGDKVNASQFDGWTVLMHAAVKSNTKTIELLLANGADITATNKDGQTAADIAEKYQHGDMAKFIKDYHGSQKLKQ